MALKNILLDTFDGKKVTVTVWDEVENKVGVVVIAHGMAEHTERYDDFATFLNTHGYVVLAENHRGHKYNPDGPKGYVDGDSWNNTIRDMRTVVEYAKATYDKEVLLLGHSYGSFLSQRFMELHGDMIKACVLSGTAYMKSAIIYGAKVIASVQKAFCGAEKTGKLIDKLSFGAYNKPFESQGQQFAWLSRDKEQVAKYEADEYCGYPLSIGFYLSFFNGVIDMYGEGADNIPKDLPVYIMVGSEDPVSNRAENATKLYKFYLEKGLTDVDIKIYKDGRHEILNEINRDEVYKDVIAFIDKQFAKR